MTDSRALYKGESSIVIEAPCDVVYNYLGDFPRHAEWSHQPTEISKLSEGPIDVGTVFRTEEQPPGEAPWILRKIMIPVMMKLVGWKGYTEAEITALEPGRRLAWKAVAPLKSGDYWMKMDWEFLLEPQSGATRVRQRYHIKPQHKLAKNMGDRAAEGMSKEVDANLARLKEILEGGAAGK